MVSLNNKDADFIANILRSRIIEQRAIISELREKMEVVNALGGALNLIPNDKDRAECEHIQQQTAESGERSIGKATKELGDLEKALILLYEGSND